jgi:8-oxo-dGTP diphosphatase
MPLPHRISAGGIVLRDDAVLLVRYNDPSGVSYLVAPGGASLEREGFSETVIREILEETGVTVRPGKPLLIESLMGFEFKMCKVWLLCEYVSGEVLKTEAARVEGIVGAGWFRREQLAGEIVFPAMLLEHDWRQFARGDWQVQCPPMREMSF